MVWQKCSGIRRSYLVDQLDVSLYESVCARRRRAVLMWLIKPDTTASMAR